MEMRSGIKIAYVVIALRMLPGGAPALAQENALEEVVVRGELRSQPGDAVDSVFGFGRSVLETPRSVSSVSGEMIQRFDMRDIDELVALAPGTYTQSFFGVAGSLDIRGTPGESYFRGMRRLDNRGNYPTPIGASSRIDIVRGPASPIFGPAKMGGYMNFTPLTAHVAETDALMSGTTGGIELGAGSWNKRTLSAQVGGPGRLGGRALGYYLYAESEDSGSYYRDSAGLDQSLVQASLERPSGSNDVCTIGDTPVFDMESRPPRRHAAQCAGGHRHVQLRQRARFQRERGRR